MTLWKDASRKERTETILLSERRREITWLRPERMARKMLREFKQGRFSREERALFLKLIKETVEDTR